MHGGRQWSLTWYVAEAAHRGTVQPAGGERYGVFRSGPQSKDHTIIKSFVSQGVADADGRRGRLEPDHVVRARAQAFADRLNAGGIERERALQEAERQARRRRTVARWMGEKVGDEPKPE